MPKNHLNLIPPPLLIMLIPHLSYLLILSMLLKLLKLPLDQILLLDPQLLTSPHSLLRKPLILYILTP